MDSKHDPARWLAPTLAYSLFAAMLFLYWIVYIMAPEFHGRVIQGEDRVVEWITFAGFFGACLVTVFLLVRHRSALPRGAILYFAMVCLFFFACAGEEISWGQRLFGFKTPPGIAAVNEQGEFNLHNLKLEHFSPKGVVTGLMKLFGYILPIVLFASMRKKDSRFRRYLSPPWLVPCFLLPELISLTEEGVAKAVARLSSETEWAEFVTRHIGALNEELQEMFWGLSVLFAVLAIEAAWRHRSRGEGPDATPRPAR